MIFDLIAIVVFFLAVIGILFSGKFVLRYLVKRGKNFNQIKILVWNYFVLSILCLAAGLSIILWLY